MLHATDASRTSLRTDTDALRARPSIEHRVLVPRFLWTAMLQEFSTRNARRFIVVAGSLEEGSERDLADTKSARLRAVSYDPRSDRVHVVVRGGPDSGRDRTTPLDAPRRIEIVRREDGRDEGLWLDHAGGHLELLLA